MRDTLTLDRLVETCHKWNDATCPYQPRSDQEHVYHDKHAKKLMAVLRRFGRMNYIEELSNGALIVKREYLR